MRRSFFVAPAIIFLIALLAVHAKAQYYFGENKIQYSQFDWQVLKTEHFEIYFYPEEKNIAETAGRLAEDSYNYLQGKFNITLTKKTPLIIYSSPMFFEQTNVVPGLLPENVAGFTEYYKERVVIPFNGSLSDFAHVIRHELTHVFTFQKIEYVGKLHSRRNLGSPPLWFTEGLAEYFSLGWDNEADMFIRDLEISGHNLAFDDLYSINGTFLMYKVGQSICRYLGTTYGDDKLTDLFDNWWKGPDFETIVGINYGKPLAKLGSEWEYALKKQYFPYIKSQELPSHSADRLTRQGYNIKPVVFMRDTRKGHEESIVFKTYRLGYSSISEMPLDGERKDLHSIIKGGRSEKFESLHFTETGMDVNRNGLLAFSSKNKENDALYIYDTKRDRVVKKIKDRHLAIIASPAWSPDSKQLVFEGIGRGGQSDLYLFQMDSNKITQLTNDIYADRTPNWSHTGNLIAFSSDRSADGNRGARNIFLYNLDNHKFTQITFGKQLDESPHWTESGDRLVFSSDRTGTMNLYMMDGVTGGCQSSTQLTDFVTGAYDPVLADHDSIIVFSGYQDGAFDIFKMATPLETIPTNSDSNFVSKSDSINGDSVSTALSTSLSMPREGLSPSSFSNSRLALADSAWSLPTLNGNLSKGEVKYHPRMTFDIAQSAVAYDQVAGSNGGLQGSLSDVLGNHQFYFLLYNTAQTKSEFIKSFNFAATYLNRTHRLNWGGGIYHFYDEYNDDYYGYVAERNYGGLVMGLYPISRYRRLEAAIYLDHTTKSTILYNGGGPKATKSSVTLSYIKDNTIWDQTGPVDGSRYNVTVAQDVDIMNIRPYSSSIDLDFRQYFRLGAASAIAERVMYFHSTGFDPQRYYLGGSWTMRGYPLRFLYGRNLLLLNNELRFPLINNMLLDFPFGKIGFSAIRGALFFDVGNAWESKLNGMYGSFGAGIRVALGYVTVLRFDFSRRTDFKSVGNHLNFDFFFGWNF